MSASSPPSPTGASHGRSPPSPWEPPAEFEGFRLLQLLGRGGMGQVHLAQDTVLDRLVALKFIATAQPNQRMRERFLLEARAIARLQHPNVVAIYRIGHVGDHPYIAYEYLGGTNLANLPKPVPWPRALAIALGIARGLAAAHGRGVLHRDVKPSNVMLSHAGPPRLIDFGLAKVVGSQSPPDDDPPQEVGRKARLPAGDPLGQAVSADTLPVDEAEGDPDPDGLLTHPGAMVGTPHYMAPEIAAGGAATERSDVYALGLVIAELLCGPVPPEEATAGEGAGVAATAPAVLSFRPDVPEPFRQVVDRCLQPRARDRYPSSADVADALTTICSLYGTHDPTLAQASVVPQVADDDVADVVDSLARVSAQGDAMVARVYEHLFRREPSLERLFPVDLAPQRQKVLTALQLAVENLSKPDRLVRLLEDLGARHVSYGVSGEHLDIFQEILLEVLPEFDPLPWSARIRGAWERAVGEIIGPMRRGLLGASRDSSRGGRTPSPTPPADLPAPPRYVFHGETSIAYQQVGEGPGTVLVVPGHLSHLEVSWESPEYGDFLRRLGALGTVLLVDKRGTGLSDPLGPGDSLETRAGDLRALLEASGRGPAWVLGWSDGAALATALGAAHPDRVEGLVLVGPRLCATAAPPVGIDAGEVARHCAEVRARWGEPLFLEEQAPSRAGDPVFRRWWSAFLRRSASPAAAIALLRHNARLDASEAAARVRAPTLILQRRDDRVVPPEAGRAAADLIPGARLVELSGGDHLPFLDDGREILSEIRRFVRQRGAGRRP